MTLIAPIEPHDPVKVAELLKVAALEDANVEALADATRALWHAREAKLTHPRTDRLHAGESSKGEDS